MAEIRLGGQLQCKGHGTSFHFSAVVRSIRLKEGGLLVQVELCGMIPCRGQEAPKQRTVGNCAKTTGRGQVPTRSVVIGRALFAIASASIAILTLSYGDFVPMGQGFPTWIHGREIWVYGSAILILATSAGLCLPRTAMPSLLTFGAYQALWTLLCVLPIFSMPRNIGSWYGFCEALTPLLSAWILYGRGVRVAQALFGLTCVFYGWSHFIYADYTAGMVPGWLPDRLGLAYFTGIAHIAAGIAMIVGILPRLAAALEAIMMSLFGLLVWVPSFFTQPRPAWATPTQNQWSELVVNLTLATCAWLLAICLKGKPWGLTIIEGAKRRVT
ncbi:MAG TPA: hypothetical protein VK700_11785 [Steroidobacteraceae bacterium]|nr:hypothetical protein [Steroidobacteraceae bacterium]